MFICLASSNPYSTQLHSTPIKCVQLFTWVLHCLAAWFVYIRWRQLAHHLELLQSSRVAACSLRVSPAALPAAFSSTPDFSPNAHHYTHTLRGFHPRAYRLLNAIAAFVGYLAAIGMIIVASFQVLVSPFSHFHFAISHSFPIFLFDSSQFFAFIQCYRRC